MNPPIYRDTLRAWCADRVAAIAAPLRAELGIDNPLAVGHYCDKCGVRLDSAERPCPLGCAA